MITLANIRRSVYNLFKRVEGIEEFLFQFITDWTDFKEEGIISNQAFPETWHKTGVLNNLIQDINADDAATTGKVYTATVSFNDLPSNMLQAELKVEIKEDSGKVILFTLISNETSPYYWLGISSYSGEVVWKSFLTEHQDISGKANIEDLATVATTGDYNDLINKPTIPTSSGSGTQLQADWNLTDNTQVDYIKNKPTIPDVSGKANSADLATVATSGSYTDLSNKPTIPDAQIQSDWNQTDNTAKDYIKNKPQVSDGKTRSPGISFEPPAKTGTNYTYVDLGLPSGTLWATKNVGASDEYDDGLYFSWGNIEGYANPSTSIFSLSNYESSIAYTLNSSIQPTTSFDAAKYNMGNPWRMPTRAEVLELIDNTDITWVANQYVKFAKKTDNSVYIIIPNYIDETYGYDATYSNSWRSAGFLCSDYKYESPGKHYGSRAVFVNNAYPDDSDYHYALAVWYYLKIPGFPVRGVQNPNDTNQIEPANYKLISAAKVAVTGSYNDLTNKPTIPQIWRGTQVQYDAITTPDSNTIYIITSAS